MKKSKSNKRRPFDDFIRDDQKMGKNYFPVSIQMGNFDHPREILDGVKNILQLAATTEAGGNHVDAATVRGIARCIVMQSLAVRPKSSIERAMRQDFLEIFENDPIEKSRSNMVAMIRAVILAESEAGIAN